METKIIELYLLICDFYDKQPVLKEQRLSNNSKPAFSDQELLTMYLFGHIQGFNQKRQIYDYFFNHWQKWFPLMPSYQAFNSRLNQLTVAFELIIEQCLMNAAWQISASNDRLIDSVPVMIARGTRANQSSVAPELANTGFCATKQQYYRGCKLHLIAARRINHLPLPEKIHLSEASQHDLAALLELAPRLPKSSALFADKAYFHSETERDFKAAGWFLLASYKRHRGESEADVPTYYNRFVSAIRQPLESLFNWLIQKTDLQNASKVRSTQGLKVHCYGKLAVACLLLTFYS